MLTSEQASLVKAMRTRGDFNHHIAAWLATNQGRPAEINTGEEYPDIEAAPLNKLPPRGAPVLFLINAVQDIKRALFLLGDNRIDEASGILKTYIDNTTRGTEFFDKGALL